MKIIGIISDTHGSLDNKILEFFSDCNQIWHAGDIGNPDILIQLKTITNKVIAVYGNIDDWEIRMELNETECFHVENVKVCIRHICGMANRINPETKKIITKEKPKILVCGHSHILQVKYFENDNLLFINPGAAGNSGFHKQKTAIKLTIDNDQIKDLKILEIPRKKS